MARQRKVNAAAFAKQMNEAVIGTDSLVEVPVDLAETASVWIKVPYNLDEGDDYAQRVARCATSEEMAMVILGEHPTLTAEEQWQTWTNAGHDAKLLINIVGSEKEAAEERGKNFRYRG